jgi:hypothetical protein
MNHKKVSWREKHGDLEMPVIPDEPYSSLRTLRILVIEDVPHIYQYRLLKYINKMMGCG